MKKTILILLCLCLLTPAAFAQNRRRRRAVQRVVTVSGCIRQGVECFVLEPLSGKQKYSVTRNSKLRDGKAYRITGPVSDISICMQGMPTISPRKVTPLRIRCPAQ
ncbi:MAG TPA: hypothetical protein VF666_07960 [Pyrinomonadaceae bacterium]|jgi:hypothetical protein